jgi:hypothetical protein
MMFSRYLERKSFMRSQSDPTIWMHFVLRLGLRDLSEVVSSPAAINKNFALHRTVRCSALAARVLLIRKI